MNKVLDGQKVRLDAKYGHSLLKTKNVPVILSTHKFSKFRNPRDQKAFDARVQKTKFHYTDFVEKDCFCQTIWHTARACNTALKAIGLSEIWPEPSDRQQLDPQPWQN